MSDMHVGLFFSNLEGGGIQRVMLNLAEGLLKAGCRVDIILVQGNGPLKSEVPEMCHLFDLQTGSASRSLKKFIIYLNSEKPSVVLSSQTHLNIVAVIARFISSWKGRLVLSEHITIDLVAQNPKYWKDRFFPFLARIFYRGADEIILVSKETANHFLKATNLPEKILRVIYNPIVSEKLIEQSKINPSHPWFSFPDTPIIIAVGRLTRQKDFGTLIKAFSIIKGNIPSAKLLILGDGEDRSQLEQLSKNLGLQEAVEFPGFVANPFSYMANSSVFVLSSLWEGFGNVLAEALACGVSIVSTDCPCGPSEILEGGKYGRLVPVGNPEALAGAILQELKFPHDKNQLKIKSLDFSIDRILPQYMESLFPGIYYSQGK